MEGGGDEQQGEVAVRWREDEGKKRGEGEEKGERERREGKGVMLLVERHLLKLSKGVGERVHNGEREKSFF